jgi:pilus assembly protein CpaB
MKPARIVILLIALAAGGIAALLAGRSERPVQIVQAPVEKLETVDVLVAATEIPLGQSITANEFRWQTWPAASAGGGNFVLRNDKPDAITQLSGSIARSAFAPGEPIRESRLIKGAGSGYMAAILPTGMRAVSTDITPETGAAGFILPNDRVDVILSRRDRDAEKQSGGGDAHSSETILSNVRVLAIDQTVEEKGGQRTVLGKTATLELTQSQAETLIVSRTMGQLSLALRSLVDASGDKPDTTDEERRGRRNGVSIVRFGVSTTTTPK